MRRKLLRIIAVLVTLISSGVIGYFGYPLLNEPETQLKIDTMDPTTVTSIISASVTQNLPQDTAFQILNSAVRIGTPTSQASGVVIYSRQNPDDPSVYTSYILTNAHVVRKHRTVSIETFNYLNRRSISGITKHTGRVMAKSSSRDLALIETTTSTKVAEEAQLLTYEDLKKCSLYSPVYISACPLGNSPFITNGNIGHITNKHYLVTAFSIFGSSGGGVFVSDGRLLGLAARIGKLMDSKGAAQPLPNLSYIIPVNVIAKWLDSRGFSFILNKDSEEFLSFLRAKETGSKYFQ